ncbi:MAG: hemerythrin domain-containing protein [Elusimicrobiota bacterium]|nr:MAG: hemerythrin domain-containing protein [Elusimicrobiota bacterium]
MLRTKTRTGTDAISMLKKDHVKVKGLFDRFEDAEETSEKKSIAEEACAELKVHAAIEEEMFYPALRQKMEDEDGLLDEADEEHHEAKILVAELGLMSGDEENFDAKFTVLAENIRHHIKEEEGELFPQAKKTEIDFDALGEQMMARKKELMAGGVPEGPESEMVSKYGLMKESPSRKAQKTFEVPVAEKRRARKH